MSLPRTLGSCVASMLFIFPMTLPAQENHVHPKVRVPPQNLAGEEAQAVELYAKILPTLVTIRTVQHPVAGIAGDGLEGLGSGVIISAEHVCSRPLMSWRASTGSS